MKYDYDDEDDDNHFKIFLSPFDSKSLFLINRLDDENLIIFLK